ncbi:hypothetical protein SCOR_31360 [Sulfidibacter corallicola]
MRTRSTGARGAGEKDHRDENGLANVGEALQECREYVGDARPKRGGRSKSSAEWDAPMGGDSLGNHVTGLPSGFAPTRKLARSYTNASREGTAYSRIAEWRQVNLSQETPQAIRLRNDLCQSIRRPIRYPQPIFLAFLFREG